MVYAKIFSILRLKVYEITPAHSLKKLLHNMQHRVECNAHRYLQYGSTEVLIWFYPKHPRSTLTYLSHIAYLELKTGEEFLLFLSLVKVCLRRERLRSGSCPYVNRHLHWCQNQQTVRNQPPLPRISTLQCFDFKGGFDAKIYAWWSGCIFGCQWFSGQLQGLMS